MMTSRFTRIVRIGKLVETSPPSHRVQALHLEVLVLDALLGPPEVDTSLHLVDDLLVNRQEGLPKVE